MTRDPQIEQEASEPTTAENYLCSHQFPAPLGRRAEQYFNHLTPEFAGAEILFGDGSRLIYDGRWTAQPAVMTPREFHLKVKRIHKRDRGDHEATHGNSEDLMDELLESLGYGAGIKYLRKQTRWCG